MQGGSAGLWPVDAVGRVRPFGETGADVGAPEVVVQPVRPAEGRRSGKTTAAVMVTGAALIAALAGGGRLAPSAGSLWLDTIRQLPLEGPLKFALATLIGLVVTAVHRPRLQDAVLARSLAHAQVLLCVSGALMMVLISDSLARAFGVAGAAGLIRFRTPVEDPKDAAVLFLLMALGMAIGLGAYPIAGSGAAMLCGLLWMLDRAATEPTRTFLVELIAAGDVFPLPHVQQVFARHQVVIEPREVCGGESARVRYLAVCPHELSLETLNADLLAAGTSGLRAVAWDPAKKKTL